MDTDLLIGMAASVILSSVKKPANRQKLKSVMLKIYRTIQNMYLGDPDFQ